MCLDKSLAFVLSIEDNTFVTDLFGWFTYTANSFPCYRTYFRISALITACRFLFSHDF